MPHNPEMSGFQPEREKAKGEMLQSRNGSTETGEYKEQERFNAQEDIRKFAKGSRDNLELNKFEADTMLMRSFVENVEKLADQFPSLELNNFEHHLVWDSLGSIDYMLWDDAAEETRTKQEVTIHGDYHMKNMQINSTLLQVYSFLHSLETSRQSKAA